MSSAILSLSSDLTGVTFPLNPVPFDLPMLGDPEMFGPPGYLIVPAGYRFVKIIGCIEVENVAAAGSIYLSVRWFDGTTPCTMNAVRQGTTGFNNNVCMTVSPWYPAEEGDTFSLRLHIGSMSGVDAVFASPNSFISMELLP